MIGFQSATTTTTSTTSASSAPNHQVSSLADATNNPMRAPSSHSPSPSSDSFTPISSPSLSSSSSTSGNHHLHNHHHQHLQLVDTSNMIQFKREKSSPPPLTMAGDDHHLRRNSPLANHISLINHHSHEQNHHNRHLHRHLHSQHLEHIKKAPPSPSTVGPVVSSPGYHSAASSPGSSISSPVSSSSGCSSAASTIGAGQQQVSSSAAAAAAAAVAVAAVAAVAANSSSLASSISPTSSTSSSRSTTTTTTITTTTTSSSSCPSSQLASTANLPNLLDYFPSANQDGLGLTWFHGANNRTRLTSGLMSNKMIIAGDISLAEMSRYPVPIMARPPLGVSDITLENWLQEVGQSQKGIKLTFTSTRTVEPAFRVLARHADQLRGPLVLNADVLARPALNFAGPGRQHQQEPQPVDAWTFLMLCRTRFPKSIISIGWCGSRASNSSNQSPINHLEHSVNNTTGVDCGQSLNFGPTGADSMFELDLVMEHQQGLSINQHLHLNAANHQHSSASRHQMGSLPLVSQLNGINHHHHHRIAGINHSNNNHHHLLSSNGSLNSSSGNSSGSPSPTSPVGHLMSSSLHHNHHHHHQQQLNLHQGHPNYLNSHHRPGAMDSTEQLILAAAAAEQQQKGVNLTSKPMGWPSLAAAAMMAVSMGSTPTSQTNQIHQQQQQQLPLNLNINEADPQHQAVALSDLAQKIQSLQQQHNLSSSSSSSSQAPPSRSSIISHHLINNQHQWPHINKKAALSSRLNSDSPSPRLSSPKQFHGQSNNNSASGNLLCVKQTTPIKSTSSSSIETNCDNSTTVGYTREMIDKMASLVKEYNLTQPVTFPVEARLLCRSSILSSNSNVVTTNNNSSLCELQRLLYQVGANSTLTIVAQQEDLIEVDDLLTIRKHFAANQILFDLPDKLANSLKQELDLL